jgi:hypothetical protein
MELFLIIVFGVAVGLWLFSNPIGVLNALLGFGAILLVIVIIGGGIYFAATPPPTGVVGLVRNSQAETTYQVNFIGHPETAHVFKEPSTFSEHDVFNSVANEFCIEALQRQLLRQASLESTVKLEQATATLCNHPEKLIQVVAIK